MFKKREENYLKNLIHYLNEFKSIYNRSIKTLQENINYLEEVLNDKSATDSTCLISLKSLKDNFEYISKYVDITLDFYKLKDSEE